MYYCSFVTYTTQSILKCINFMGNFGFWGRVSVLKMDGYFIGGHRSTFWA